MKLPLAIHAWRGAMRVAGYGAPMVLGLRARRGKEDPTRRGERDGYPGRARPRGPLAWLHGASVGESVSLLPIVDELTLRGISVLVTSGTVTSAEVLGRRLPPGAIHQFAPLDTPQAMRRFMAAWRPDLLLIAESELWPTMLTEAARNAVPVALVNARMSERSYLRWRRVRGVIGALLGLVDQCIAQSEADAARFRDLGARNVSVGGNLKFDVDAPPAHPVNLATLSARLAGRPLWLAASTHPGEEDMVIAAHAIARASFPDLITIVAPRHPDRGEAVMVACREAGLPIAMRSRGENPDRDTAVYIADTIGELGLFFRLSPLVFMGGSLAPHGGQNPIEPGKLGLAILHGPHVGNFYDTYAAIDAAGGSIEVADAQTLGHAVATLLANQATLREMSRAALDAVTRLTGATDRTMEAIAPYLAWMLPESR